MPVINRGSGTGSPCTRNRATPPSGWMDSRTWVNRRSSSTGKGLSQSPASGDRGTSVTHSARSSSAGEGWPSTPVASTEADGG